MRRFTWLVPTIYIVILMLPIYWLVNMSFKTTTEIINTFSLYPQNSPWRTMPRSSPIRHGTWDTSIPSST